MHESLGPTAEGSRRCRVADISPKLLYGTFELGVLEGSRIERPHLSAVGEQTPRKVKPEEPRTA